MAQEPETEVARSIRLPQKLWEVLETDAKRCKRSAVKQLEALLTKWYGIDDVEIQFDRPEGSDVRNILAPDSIHPSSSHQSSSKTTTKKRAKTG